MRTHLSFYIFRSCCVFLLKDMKELQIENYQNSMQGKIKKIQQKEAQEG
jgi:hypothetical protein